MRFRTGLLRISSLALAALAQNGCASATPAVTSQHAAAGPSADPSSERAGESAAPLPAVIAWSDLTPAVFARAKAEHRFVLLDGAAEWCHWCHVMDATTYHDAAVVEILRDRFVAVKVDVDARPDVAERYGDWGWPATVLYSPDAEEIGKFKGYIDPARFADILRGVVASGGAGAGARDAGAAPAPKGALSEEELSWIERMTELELADYQDDAEGGWGKWQKAPLAWDDEWLLSRAKAGDADARKRALFTLGKERALIDPVWGGMSQYSAASDWTHPHFEKLMAVQAGAIDAYASAFLLTRDAAWLASARAIASYVARFMTAPDGGFYTTQDADLNAHDPSKPFVDGHAYYAKSEAERLALGLPRIDTHEYGRENGLVIAAYATLYDATKDAAVLAAAEKAAATILSTHAAPGGGVFHDTARPEVKWTYLADNAAMAWAMVRLYEVTQKPEHLDAAARIADAMVKGLYDEKRGGFASVTADDRGVGVFATRRIPFEDNALAVRALSRIARAKKTDAYRDAIDGALRAIATPDAIKARGRMLGDFLLALSESKGAR